MRPDWRILIDGQDRSEAFRDRLLSLTITDESGYHSDTVSVRLDDRESVASSRLSLSVASLRALFCGCQRRSGGSILIRYFDSSALVKRYVREAGSDVVEGLLASGPAAISRLTEVEVTSALARRTRTGDCSVEERDVALAMLARDMDSFLVVELVAAVTRRESVAHSRLSLSVASRDMDSFLVVELVAAVTRRESVAHSRLSLSVASSLRRARPQHGLSLPGCREIRNP